MDAYLALGTSEGCVLAAYEQDRWRVVGRGLAEHAVTAVAAGEGHLWAGTRDGIYRSGDRGQTWQEASAGLLVRHVRWMTCTAEGLLAGTEPAAIYGWQAGAGWQERPEVARLRDRHGWWLPYSPEDGCVRGFAAHGTTGRAYAAAEVGGVLRSDDGGRSWDLAPGSGPDPRNFEPPATVVHPDVHSITVHPSSEDVVTAPTGGGLYRSTDGGVRWALLYPCYCRAAWVDPDDADQIVFGPADGVARNGRIERSLDGGQTWQPAGALEVPWPRHMVERFLQVGGTLLAVLSNGALLAAPLEALDWQPVLSEVVGIRCAALF